MHFSVFIPDAVGANPKLLETVGLGDLARDGGLLMQEMPDKGPNGGRGLLFSWAGSPPVYLPQQQTWQPAKPDAERGLAAGRFWWGYTTNEPPTSADLKRDTQLAGMRCKVGDHTWLMPNILLLPHKFVLGDDGQEQRVPMNAHRPLYERGLWAFGMLKTQIEGTAKAPGTQMRRYVLEMLSLNYRIFRELADLLELLEEDIWFSLACASVDMDLLTEIEDEVAKKKQREFEALLTPPTSKPGAGPEASPPPATNPAAKTS